MRFRPGGRSLRSARQSQIVAHSSGSLVAPHVYIGHWAKGGALRLPSRNYLRRRTRRWRKTDSNHRSLSGRIPLFRLVLPVGGVEEACSEKPPVLTGGPAVRIRLPPAESQ